MGEVFLASAIGSLLDRSIGNVLVLPMASRLSLLGGEKQKRHWVEFSQCSGHAHSVDDGPEKVEWLKWYAPITTKNHEFHTTVWDTIIGEATVDYGLAKQQNKWVYANIDP